MKLTTDQPTRALLLSTPRPATWGRDGAAKTDLDGVPLAGAFFLLIATGRPVKRWVEWPTATPPPVSADDLPMMVVLDGLTVEMYDRKDGQGGVSLRASTVVPSNG